MTSKMTRLFKGAVIVAVTGALSACGLPRSGPNKAELFSSSVLEEGDAFVVVVNDRVNSIASVAPRLDFAGGFRQAGLVGSDTIQPGDTLGLTIWENVDDGLLVPEAQNAVVLDEIQVDGNGFIFVPYAGRIRAAGNTPEAVRRIITNRIAEQTPDPQVEVRRLAGDGSTISVVGTVGAQGVYAIERPTRTLSAMLARAGGVNINPEIAKVTVTRGSHHGTIWFTDLYDHPGHDIALRNGDRIIVEEDERAFTALGATGTQTLVTFDRRTISAVEAIAQVGGLSPTRADPTGVFVLRNEPEEIAERIVGAELTGSQRVVYVLDLTQPSGVFMARDFAIRDGDTVYVTEAPFVQWNTTISALTGTLGAVGSLSSAVDTLSGGSSN